MFRSYEELLANGVVSTLTFNDDEIRYSVTKNGTILYNQALFKYSSRRAAQLSREQDEVAHRASLDADALRPDALLIRSVSLD